MTSFGGSKWVLVQFVNEYVREVASETIKVYEAPSIMLLRVIAELPTLCNSCTLPVAKLTVAPVGMVVKFETICPWTFRAEAGAVVPMPTLPVVSTTIRVAEAVLSTIANEPGAPGPELPEEYTDQLRGELVLLSLSDKPVALKPLTLNASGALEYTSNSAIGAVVPIPTELDDAMVIAE